VDRKLSLILFLEVYGTEVAEIRMAALPIVEHFDIFKNVRFGSISVCSNFN